MTDPVRDLDHRLDTATQKLGKWRSLFAGWWFGTRPNSDPQAQAARDNFDRTIMLRCEMNALTQLLTEKQVFSPSEFKAQLVIEVQAMDKMLEKSWPGFHTSSVGLEMDLMKASQTMRERGFPA